MYRSVLFLITETLLTMYLGELFSAETKMIALRKAEKFSDGFD